MAISSTDFRLDKTHLGIRRKRGSVWPRSFARRRSRGRLGFSLGFGLSLVLRCGRRVLFDEPVLLKELALDRGKNVRIAGDLNDVIIDDTAT